MDTTGFGVPTGGSVDHDAPTRHGVGIARRLCTLFGLALGCWLIGLALHAATADAAPADPHRPAGPVDRVQHAAGTTGTAAAAGAVRHVAEQVAPHVAERVVSHTAPAADRVARRTNGVVRRATGVVRHAVGHPVRTVGHVVDVVREVAQPVVRPVVRKVVRPAAGTITAVPAPEPTADRAAHRAVAAPRVAQHVTTVPTRPVPGVTNRQAQPSTARLSAPVLRVVVPLPWPLDIVPSSPHSPQPLPISPAGSVTAGGTVPSGHENGATLADRATTQHATRGGPVTPARTTPVRTVGKRPGFSPD